MDRKVVFDCYSKAISKHEKLKVKGAKTLYTAINGNMFSFIDDQGRVCLRFSERRKVELNNLYGSTDVLQYGSVMRGYVSLPGEVTTDETALDKLFSESLAFAKNLKPKPTTKKTR